MKHPSMVEPQDEQPRDEAFEGWRGTFQQVGTVHGNVYASTAGPAEGWRATQWNEPIRAEFVSDGEVYARSRYAEQFVIDARRGVDGARSRYRRLMKFYWALRAAVIISGVVVATLAATGVARWLTAVFGALAAACETTIIAASLQSRAVTAGLLAEGMARELRQFEIRRGPYAVTDRNGVLFDRIEALRESASMTRFRLDGHDVNAEPTRSIPDGAAANDHLD